MPIYDQRYQHVNEQYNAARDIHIYPPVPPRPVDQATLAAAEQRLAALPLDTIPAPAPLPPGSRMPLSPNPLFVGRAADLQTLAAALKGGETAAIGPLAAATGLGGIGKTQLASEFAHRYGQFFAGGVFWLSFADPAAVPAEVVVCGGPGALDLHLDFHTLSLEDQVRLVRAAWQSPLPRLLVFDNCEDEALLAQWQPPSGGCRVLVTSRRAQWDAALGVRALPLGVLRREESVALLRKHRPDLPADAADLDAIAAELGDLPLALHLAGSFLARYRHALTPAEYLAQLRRPDLLEHRSLQGWKLPREVSPTRHEPHVARTFTLSYERLNAADPTDILAQALLVRAAHFAPGEPIPRDLLLATLDLDENDLGALFQAEDALGQLAALGLLEPEAEGALRLHRLLTVFVQATATDVEAQAAVEQAMMERALHLNQAGYPASLLAVQVHLRAITDVAQRRGDERAGSLCNLLGYHLWVIGNYAGARSYTEQALAIHKTVLGEQHPVTITNLNNLGVLLTELGALARAQFYLEWVLAIREAVLGERHLDTANSLNNLGELLLTQGDLIGARSYLERALAIHETVLGEHHPKTALSLVNLGVLLQKLGNLAGARPHLERALGIYEAVLGADHPDTARSLNSLGMLLWELGYLAEARSHLERALAICEAVLGEGHPWTASSLNNLGGLLRDLGDLGGARSYYEQALTIRETMLGADHPDTAASLNNLGHLLCAEGDLAEARLYFERALRILQERLGQQHPSTQTVLRHLATLEAHGA